MTKAIKCTECGDTIQENAHECRACKCCNVFVEGEKFYIRDEQKTQNVT